MGIVQECHATRRILSRRTCQREDHNRRFLALQAVNGADSCLGSPSRNGPNVGIVRGDDQEIFNLKFPDDSIAVTPLDTTPDEVINQRRNRVDLLAGSVLIPCMRDWYEEETGT